MTPELASLRFPAFAIALFAHLLAGSQARADFRDLPHDPKPGDLMMAEFFEQETARLAARTLADIRSRKDWEEQRDARRGQLFEMLGLSPLPERSPLNAKIAGQTGTEEIVVEKILFESSPGLYVTGNFYRPKQQDAPLPAILYLCGHGRVKIDGVSYGNKSHYQHHGAWFARNGYVCLTIDTLQLGEIEGIHHGTHNLGRWWWNARGYTPAGVEAWNSIRALDYLETRPEADPDRFGVTGRSGGGAYSWWIAALDERIKAAVPVAGIASLKNHVVDGCIEGHCDCMFQVNTYRWDYPMIAALVAPRPLLIANTDKDRIFPLDGVVDVYQKARRIYELCDAGDKIGLAIYEGPHKDTQPLRVAAFHWFERFLKGRDIGDEISDCRATALFEPRQLKVLDAIPEDEQNTTIDEHFTPGVAREQDAPETEADWRAGRDLWMQRLATHSFRAWPDSPPKNPPAPVADIAREGLRFRAFDFVSQDKIRLRLYLFHREDLAPADLDLAVLEALDEKTWPEFLAGPGAVFPEGFEGIDLPDRDQERFSRERQQLQSEKLIRAYVAPRGIGPTAWTDDEKERTHLHRRFQLLGMTVDSARTWDIRRAIQTLRQVADLERPELRLQARGVMAGNALYASLFEPGIQRLDLRDLPASHREGPEYLNVLRFLDLPQALAMAAERSRVRLHVDSAEDWDYVNTVGRLLGWEEKQFEQRAPTTD